MSSQEIVLDASAFLAYLHGEPGAEIVKQALVTGASISAVNWAEVLSKLAENGQDPREAARELEDKGILGVALTVRSVDESLAVRIAELRPLTRQMGLSLGDRTCLALAAQLQLPVLTADRNWKDLDVGVEIRLVRHQEPTP